MASLSSVRKALRILESFSPDQPELGVTEISSILRSHKSSVFRVLTTLTSEGFVEKNPLTNKY
ncbi:MAG: helix-turn-helix domain-containing protein, partial [Proteobacteria bacterium]|nr:helix-turn-helix domain-containing protein [Pseudomonadota bacterium]